MTLTIEIESEREARLLEEAARHGLDAASYLRYLVEQHLQSEHADMPLRGSAVPAERAKAFRVWAEGHRLDSPPLSDAVISREAIYGERG
jgi:hypothetical protein